MKEKIKNEYDIRIEESDYRKHQQLKLKLKLWNEQDGKCLYCGKPIQITDLLNQSDLFEIDHIIPRSMSFDVSRSN